MYGANSGITVDKRYDLCENCIKMFIFRKYMWNSVKAILVFGLFALCLYLPLIPGIMFVKKSVGILVPMIVIAIAYLYYHKTLFPNGKKKGDKVPREKNIKALKIFLIYSIPAFVVMLTVLVMPASAWPVFAEVMIILSLIPCVLLLFPLIYFTALIANYRNLHKTMRKAIYYYINVKNKHYDSGK